MKDYINDTYKKQLITSDTRNRLQDFYLELSKRYPKCQIEGCASLDEDSFLFVMGNTRIHIEFEYNGHWDFLFIEGDRKVRLLGLNRINFEEVDPYVQEIWYNEQ